MSSFNSRTPGGVRRAVPTRLRPRHMRFNSRTPGGVRPMLLCNAIALALFQFTHPGRGATRYSKLSDDRVKFQFTHPGRGATRPKRVLYTRLGKFQFTHPGRGATSKLYVWSSTSPGFNSRTPGGVRLYEAACVGDMNEFQFTHPGRGATAVRLFLLTLAAVSIHAPREGCDYPSQTRAGGRVRFNSRTPGGVRRQRLARPLY